MTSAVASTQSTVGLPPPPVPDETVTVSISNNDEKVSEKELKRKRNRERAITELITTEQTYVSNLRLLNEFYYKPLTNNKIIKQKYIQSIFGEIETIINLNDNLLNTLKSNVEKDKIGEAMLQFIPFLKMYQNYINKHQQSTKLLSELVKNNNEFGVFLNEQQNNGMAGGQSLHSFLILPIQRVPRYELCLKEIIKLTSASNGDLVNLQQCFDCVCNVNKAINERINEFHDRAKVKAIEERFGLGQNISLVAPARTFIREGYLLKVSRKKDIKYLFILFSDLLIYCSSNSNNKKLKLHQRLPFDLYFKVQRVDNNRKYGNKCFELNSSTKSFLVITENNGIRESWCDDIQSSLDRMRANRTLKDSKKFDIDSDRILDVAPVWIPDDFSDRCMIPQCMKKFTFTRRRHHCRYCGRLICSSCSKNQLPHFNRNSNEIVRVGSLCYDKYKQYFPDFDLKVNRKNKSSYSISSTPKGAEYEINWDDEEDTDSEPEETQESQECDEHNNHMSNYSNYSNLSNISFKSKTALSYKANISSTNKIMKAAPTAVPIAESNSNVYGRYQAMINAMQSKLNKERKHNLELEGQIEDLRAENQRLRKSKVDLMTWSNGEIAKYKKEILFLTNKRKAKQTKLSEGH